MRKIIFLLMACMFAFVSNITFGTDTKHQLTEQIVVVDSVKGVSIDKVKTLLCEEGFKKQGTITKKGKERTKSYGFYLKFLNLNGSKDPVKNSYDFGDYSVKWDECPLGSYRVVVVITKNKEEYIINFE